MLSGGFFDAIKKTKTLSRKSHYKEEPEMSSLVEEFAMSIIDIILVTVVLLSVWRGVSNGFILETINLVSWTLSIALTFLIFPRLARLLLLIGSIPGAWRVSLSFLAVLLVCSLAISAISNSLLGRVPEKSHQALSNRIAGIVPGLVGGLLKAAIVAVLLLLIPIAWHSQEKARDSKAVSWLTEAFRGFESWVGPELQAIQTAFLKTEERDANKLVKLNFTVTRAPERPELEKQMLALINQERTKAGLPALAADRELTQVARLHSRDMFSRGYFSHVSPEGETPFDRIRKANIRFLTAGENLALARNLGLAHDGLMKSPGHRANILHPSYGRVGIGILDGGIYGLMVTQNFRD